MQPGREKRMSKLSFRARALDPSKQMPIFLAEELPDLPEYSAINRAVPQMPSGMEKEEESEHHLQRAICAGLIIPTPEVYSTDAKSYDENYPDTFRMPRQLIHMQFLGLEQDIPEYDADTEDECWLNEQGERLKITIYQFEQMMDALEKSSGQTVVTLNEAKALLNQDDETSMAVYDYWLNKRLKLQHPLILTVKIENRPGASSNNPYLAFRRRTEKMQTRKNRKNDEASYEKMLRLRRDLHRTSRVLEMVKKREQMKFENLHLSMAILEKRLQLRDFSGSLVNELSATIPNYRPDPNAPVFIDQYQQYMAASGASPASLLPGIAATSPSDRYNNVLMGLAAGSGCALERNSSVTGGPDLYSTTTQYLNSSQLAIGDTSSASSRKEKRQYKKRKHKIPRDKSSGLIYQQPTTSAAATAIRAQQQQYLVGISEGGVGGGGDGMTMHSNGIIPASGITGASMMSTSSFHHRHHPHHHSHHSHHTHHSHHHHHHHLQHSQHGSTAAGRLSPFPGSHEAIVDVDGEELLLHNKHHHQLLLQHPLGSEGEEEAPFAFRRKQGCDYLRSRMENGNWPWEMSSKADDGFGDRAKYRYTLTSIRHPRPKCIGFARRRLGRGGRILLDRVSTDFDKFWSELDYTLFEGEGGSQNQNQIMENIKPAIDESIVEQPPASLTDIDGRLSSLLSAKQLSSISAVTSASSILKSTNRIPAIQVKNNNNTSKNARNNNSMRNQSRVDMKQDEIANINNKKNNYNNGDSSSHKTVANNLRRTKQQPQQEQQQQDEPLNNKRHNNLNSYYDGDLDDSSDDCYDGVDHHGFQICRERIYSSSLLPRNIRKRQQQQLSNGYHRMDRKSEEEEEENYNRHNRTLFAKSNNSNGTIITNYHGLDDTDYDLEMKRMQMKTRRLSYNLYKVLRDNIMNNSNKTSKLYADEEVEVNQQPNLNSSTVERMSESVRSTAVFGAASKNVENDGDKTDDIRIKNMAATSSTSSSSIFPANASQQKLQQQKLLHTNNNIYHNKLPISSSASFTSASSATVTTTTIATITSTTAATAKGASIALEKFTCNNHNKSSGNNNDNSNHYDNLATTTLYSTIDDQNLNSNVSESSDNKLTANYQSLSKNINRDGDEALRDNVIALNYKANGINNNNVSNTKTNSNINSDLNINEILHVIKTENVSSDEEGEVGGEGKGNKDATLAATSTANHPNGNKYFAIDIHKIEVKQEYIQSCDDDDSNEPLSSIQKMTTNTNNNSNNNRNSNNHTPSLNTFKSSAATSIPILADRNSNYRNDDDNILEDEENVNLAQLSNLIKHTIKAGLVVCKTEEDTAKENGDSRIDNHKNNNQYTSNLCEQSVIDTKEDIVEGNNLHHNHNCQQQHITKHNQSNQTYKSSTFANNYRYREEEEEHNVHVLNEVPDVMRVLHLQLKESKRNDPSQSMQLQNEFKIEDITEQHRNNVVMMMDVDSKEQRQNILSKDNGVNCDEHLLRIGIRTDDTNDEVDGDKVCDVSDDDNLSQVPSPYMDICKDLLTEISRDWLHFRPKSPNPKVDNFQREDQNCKENGHDGNMLNHEKDMSLVNWSQNTPLTLEMISEPLVSATGDNDNIRSTTPSKMLDDYKEMHELWNHEFLSERNRTDIFIGTPFQYVDLSADTSLNDEEVEDSGDNSDTVMNSINSESCSHSSHSNVSGDSLNLMNMIDGDMDIDDDDGDDDDGEENADLDLDDDDPEESKEEEDGDILDNILQEVQSDDAKALNQATNFWNGILDGEVAADNDEVLEDQSDYDNDDADSDDSMSTDDNIVSKKRKICEDKMASSLKCLRRKRKVASNGGKRSVGGKRFVGANAQSSSSSFSTGCSSFVIKSSSNCTDEVFFSKAIPIIVPAKEEPTDNDNGNDDDDDDLEEPQKTGAVMAKIDGKEGKKVSTVDQVKVSARKKTPVSLVPATISSQILTKRGLVVAMPIITANTTLNNPVAKGIVGGAATCSTSVCQIPVTTNSAATSNNLKSSTIIMHQRQQLPLTIQHHAQSATAVMSNAIMMAAANNVLHQQQQPLATQMSLPGLSAALTQQQQQQQSSLQTSQIVQQNAHLQPQLATIQVLHHTPGTGHQIRNYTVQQLQQYHQQQQQHYRPKLQLQQQQQQQQQHQIISQTQQQQQQPSTVQHKFIMHREIAATNSVTQSSSASAATSSQQSSSAMVATAVTTMSTTISNNSLPTTSILTQFITNSSSSIASTITPTATLIRHQQQPTLTPIVGCSPLNNVANQMVYTTTATGDVIATAGAQKFFLQKTSLATVGGGSATATVAASSPAVNSVGGGHHLTVQNITGIHNVTATTSTNVEMVAPVASVATLSISSASVSTSSCPLMVTAATSRGVVQQLMQQQQQQLVASGIGIQTSATQLHQHAVLGHATQQIVWRQIGGTNMATATAAAAATSQATIITDGGTAAGGNRIVWATRPGQKRQQINGPDNTDINKFLLSRKFSQRKIITTQQHQQQLQKHLIENDTNSNSMNTSGDARTTSTGATTTTVVSSNVSASMITMIGGGAAPSSSSATGGNIATTYTVSGQGQQFQKLSTGKLIKVPSFPLLLSDMGLQHSQQHQLQQVQQHIQQQHQSTQSKHNINSNHNYSIQTSGIITTQAQISTGNKIFLTNSAAATNGSGGGIGGVASNATSVGLINAGLNSTSFTITNASDLQNAAQKLQQQQKQQHQQQLQQNNQQGHNLKLNFVSAATGVTGGATILAHHQQAQQPTTYYTTTHHQNQQQSLQQQLPISVSIGGQHLQPHQATAVLLNKASMSSQHQQQLLQHSFLQPTGKLKRDRILNIIGTTNSLETANSGGGGSNITNASGNGVGTGGQIANVIGVTCGAATIETNNKRVVYTNLLNVKPLQKNNVGQMQVQIAPQCMTHAVIRGRLAGGNSSIFTNMRTCVPIGTAVTSVAGNGGGNNSTTAINILNNSSVAGNSKSGTNNCGGVASTAATVQVLSAGSLAHLNNVLTITNANVAAKTNSGNGGGSSNKISNNNNSVQVESAAISTGTGTSSGTTSEGTIAAAANSSAVQILSHAKMKAVVTAMSAANSSSKEGKLGKNNSMSTTTTATETSSSEEEIVSSSSANAGSDNNNFPEGSGCGESMAEYEVMEATEADLADGSNSNSNSNHNTTLDASQSNGNDSGDGNGRNGDGKGIGGSMNSIVEIKSTTNSCGETGMPASVNVVTPMLTSMTGAGNNSNNTNSSGSGTNVNNSNNTNAATIPTQVTIGR